jgi:hypothetical protein
MVQTCLYTLFMPGGQDSRCTPPQGLPSGSGLELSLQVCGTQPSLSQSMLDRAESGAAGPGGSGHRDWGPAARSMAVSQHAERDLRLHNLI